MLVILAEGIEQIASLAFALHGLILAYGCHMTSHMAFEATMEVLARDAVRRPNSFRR